MVALEFARRGSLAYWQHQGRKKERINPSTQPTTARAPTAVLGNFSANWLLFWAKRYLKITLQQSECLIENSASGSIRVSDDSSQFVVGVWTSYIFSFISLSLAMATFLCLAF